MLGTALSLGVGAGPLMNGQANLHLAACMLDVSASVATRHWWAAASLLALGLSIKPLMIAMLLLCAALYRPVSWRTLCTVSVAAALPWRGR